MTGALNPILPYPWWRHCYYLFFLSFFLFCFLVISPYSSLYHISSVMYSIYDIPPPHWVSRSFSHPLSVPSVLCILPRHWVSRAFFAASHSLTQPTPFPFCLFVFLFYCAQSDINLLLTLLLLLLLFITQSSGINMFRGSFFSFITQSLRSIRHQLERCSFFFGGGN